MHLPGPARVQAPGVIGHRLPLPWQFSEVLDYWDTRYGITSSGERVSAWAPTLKGSHSLDQGTGANQPILLSWDGVNYLRLSGVSGNYASTPDSESLSITGSIDIRALIALDNWSSTSDQQICSKFSSAGNFSWAFYKLGSAKTLAFAWWPDGTNIAGNSASSSDIPVNNFDELWVRATLDAPTGDYKYWISTDYNADTLGGAWTQLGSTRTVSGATSIFNGNANVEFGSRSGGTAALANGKCKRVQIFDGIEGILVCDSNFTAVSEGATSFTESSSNAATVTINSTGAKPAQIVGSQQLLFDGSAHFLKASAFTLNQPETIILLLKPVTWSQNDALCDGNTDTTALVRQGAFGVGTSPQVTSYAGTLLQSVDATVGSYGAVAAVFNGASSVLQYNTGTPVTGNAGSSNAGGFTLGSVAAGNNQWSNIQVKAAAICNSALSQSRLNQLIRAMATQYGVSL